MNRIALVAIAALLLAGFCATTALSESQTHSTPHAPPPPSCTAAEFGPFADAVWDPQNWERGAPPHAVIAAERKRLKCASPGNRRAMQERWQKDKTKYNRRRTFEIKWQGCPDHIRLASLHYSVMGWLLYGIEGAESGWGSGGSNLFGILGGGVNVSDPYEAAMEAAHILRREHDSLGGWEAAMLQYSGHSYGLSHPRELAGDTCP